MKKTTIPPFVAILVTLVAFLWTSRILITSGDQLQMDSPIARFVAVTVFAWVGSSLWVSIVSVGVVLPLSILINGSVLPENGEQKGMLVFFLVSGVLIWVQFFIFGNGIPFVLMPSS